MSANNLSEQMCADWNARALEDAYYYAAFGGRGQDDDEFFGTAAEIVHALESELQRLPAGERLARRGLEIGCGPGRLMRPMSGNFGEIHGVDVSGEMIRVAQQKLEGVPNAHLKTTNGTDLACYAAESFDYVYSYAVFQHIPDPQLVFSYLAEARRVLKPDGILRCQLNGLPKTGKPSTTWEGVRIGAGEIAEFVFTHDFQLLALEGVDTQYMWVTMRKRAPGWFAALAEATSQADAPWGAARILHIENARTGSPVISARGRFASMSLLIEHMPEDCDLNQINIVIEGQEAAPIYIGPSVWPGVSKVNAMMPAGVRTGLVPVQALWFGRPLPSTAWARVIPPAPAVPRLASLSDGVNLLSGARISSRSVRLFVEDLEAPDQLEVRLDATPIGALDVSCADPVNRRFEISFQLPDAITAGAHVVELRAGSRRFPPAPIDVA